MSIIQYEGKTVRLEDNESALEALLREGFDIPNSCRAGLCQSCIMTVAEGNPDPAAQVGLSDQQIALNQVLACQCYPDKMLRFQNTLSADDKTPATVIERSWLNQKVLRLRLKADVSYRPGQFLNLWRDNKISRSYSLASHPALNDYLEFHIKYIPDGKFSSWVAKSLNEGDQLLVQGPLGKCIYSGKTEQPILLMAIGTGLAPIYGILQDALKQNHNSKIHIILGANNGSDFYLVKELQAIQALHPEQIDLNFLCQNNAEGPAVEGDIYKYCKERFPSLEGYGIYLCGAQSFVNKMRKQCFISGASMSDIASDPFIPSES